MKIFSVVAMLTSLSSLVAISRGIQEREALREQVEQVRREASFWRKMYVEAESDAKVLNCVDLDTNFTICEKPRH